MASLLMSILTDDGTPQDRALDSIIDIYVLCRVIVIVSGFFLQPDAPRLRLLQMGDAWAAFMQRWVVHDRQRGRRRFGVRGNRRGHSA